MGDVGLNYLPFSGMDEAREAISSFGKEFLGRDYAPIKYSLHNGGAQSILISAFAPLNRSDYVVGIVPGATFRSEGEWFRMSYSKLSKEEMSLLFRAIDEEAGKIGK